MRDLTQIEHELFAKAFRTGKNKSFSYVGQNFIAKVPQCKHNYCFCTHHLFFIVKEIELCCLCASRIGQDPHIALTTSWYCLVLSLMNECFGLVKAMLARVSVTQWKSGDTVCAKQRARSENASCKVVSS